VIHKTKVIISGGHRARQQTTVCELKIKELPDGDKSVSYWLGVGCQQCRAKKKGARR